MMKQWSNQLALEEAIHFNPAFCGALIYEFVRAYQNAKKAPVPFALVFCALPIALHPATRRRLPATIATKLFPWLEDNPDALIGFSDRARNLTPYVRRALSYAALRHAISFNSGGTISVGPKRASFTPSALDKATADIRLTVEAIRKVARWFAAAGSTSTILAAWGIRT